MNIDDEKQKQKQKQLSYWEVTEFGIGIFMMHMINTRSFSSYYIVRRGFIDLIFWMTNLKLKEVK